MLQHDLHWEAVLDAELCDEEILAAARAVHLGVAELRSSPTYEGAAAAMHRELATLGATDGPMGDERRILVAEANAALTRYVRAQLTLAIERRTEHAYSLNLTVDSTTGLTNRAHALRTEVTARLRKACISMDGGSVAIVGPNGIDKSRLVEHFCGAKAHDDRRTISTVIRAAPGDDALDFVMELLARLCQEVLDRVAADDMTLRRASRVPQRHANRAATRWSRLGAILAWGGASLIVIGAFDVRTDLLLIVGMTCLVLAAAISRTRSSVGASDAAWRVGLARLLRQSGEQLPLIGVGVGLIAASQFGTNVDPLVVVGAMLLAIASAMRGPPAILRHLFSRRRPPQPPPAIPPGLVETARVVLDQLEGTKTVVFSESRKSDGRVGKRLSLRLGNSSKISEKQAPIAWTVRKAVRMLEDFVRKDAKDLGIWIGIDLQGMRPARSQPFLEDIGSVLSLDRNGCFVLVCVLGQGSQVPVVHERCNRVISLQPLGFPDSHGLLGHDGIGLSMPFAALCHVLSGGVLKDLVDHATALVDHKPLDCVGRMSDMARALVMPQLRSHAADVHDRALGDCRPDMSDVLDWVRDVRTRCGSAEALLALHARRASLPRSDESAQSHAREVSSEPSIDDLTDRLAAHCYFAATVLAFFHDALSRAAFDNALHGEPPPLEILREARSVLSINPHHASSLVRDFRTTCALEPEGT